MGAISSSLRDAAKALRALATMLRDLGTQYRGLITRVNAAPGLPGGRPTAPYWLEDPPFPDLVDVRSPALPGAADVVVIGSGITGAAVARSILRRSGAVGGAKRGTMGLEGEEKEADGAVPRVVVLEARQLCSGATGRNGGHIKASPHETFARLRKSVGPERAAALTRFQLRSLEVLLGVCAEEGIDIAECREVETVDLFLDEKGFEKGRKMCAELAEWVPEFEMTIWDGEGARQKFGANQQVVGAITYAAGAIWPYRFVASIWKGLLTKFGSSLAIETGTPVTSIDINPYSSSVLLSFSSSCCSFHSSEHYPYLVHTPRGSIRARHVVHATNAHASHLVPGLRGKMAGIRAHMSAQRPGVAFPDRRGAQSWSVFYGSGFDYVTQRPSGPGDPPGDLLLGGGFAVSEEEMVRAVGSYDDSAVDALSAAHLFGVFPTIFGPANWGREAAGGREKMVWTGVLAVTGDFRPFVGRLDERLTGRKVARSSAGSGRPGEHDIQDVQSGEWISAGYCGDGMVWAWMCGTALGRMIIGEEVDDFPVDLLASMERVKKADLMNLLEELM